MLDRTSGSLTGTRFAEVIAIVPVADVIKERAQAWQHGGVFVFE